MKTTSSKMLKVGLAVAEDANAREALSGIKLALMNNIQNWTEHWSMLVYATAFESCSSIVLITKV